MSYLKKILLNPIIFNYIFVFVLALSNVMFINNIVNPFIKVFAIWATFLIIYAFMKKKYAFKLYFIIFVAFIISVLVTNLINYKDNLYLNTVMFVFVACYILVNLSSYKINFNTVIKFNNIYIIVTIIFALLSLISFSMNVSYQIGDLYYGYHWGVFYGVFSNPNSGSMICMFSIPMIMFNLYYHRYQMKDINSVLKAIYIIGIVIISIYLFLADSRGALLCLLGFLFTFIILYTYKFLKGKKKVFVYITTLIISILLGILVIKSPLTQLNSFLVNNGIISVEKVEEETPAPTDTNKKEESKNDTTKNEKPATSNINRKESNISSSRFILWKGALEGVKANPVFGVGQANVLNVVKEITKDESIINISAGGVHNGYLDLLLSCGFVGFLLFIIGVGLFYLKTMKIFLQTSGDKSVLFIIEISLITGIFINNLVETSMIMAIFITTQMLWLHMGIVNNLEGALESENEKND